MSAVAAVEASTGAYHPTWLKRRVREAVHSAIFSDVPVAKEKMDVRVKPGFDTACWAYLPPHRVYVGDQIAHRAREGLSDEQHAQYVANHVFHEFAHALWTDRDLASLQRDVEEIAPFSLFNVFEDARIECRYRSTFGHRFQWAEFEKLTLQGEPPTVLLAFIQAEGERPALDAAAVAEDLEVGELIDQVEAFYRRIVEAKSSRALFPILCDWVEQFGLPPKSSRSPADLAQAVTLVENPEAREEFESNTIQVNGQDGPSGRGGTGTAESIEVTEVDGNAHLLVESVTPVCAERTQRITARLARFFAKEARIVSTDVPSRRISVRNYVAGRPCYRRAETQGRKRRKVLLVLDCSGSMSGFHLQEGLVLVAALSELARRGIVNGHVVLSCVLDKACWQRFALPMPLEFIERIAAYGCAEGLEYALSENLAVAREADYVFVYTDGQICDAPINKRALHSRGVFTWGLYAGSQQGALRELVRYFDKAILRTDAEHLVEAMLLQRS